MSRTSNYIQSVNGVHGRKMVIHLSRNSNFQKNRREKCALHRCVKKFQEVNKTRFAYVSLGKVSFCLISFDAQLCLKRNLEGNIVPWIVKTYSSLKKFYTMEVEKNRKNHLSLSKRRQKRLCLPPVQETMESQRLCARIFSSYCRKGVLSLPYSERFFQKTLPYLASLSIFGKFEIHFEFLIEQTVSEP